MSYQGPQTFEPQAPRQNPWGAILRVITDPAATFRDFEGRVPIFPAYLVAMVVGLAASAMSIPTLLKGLDQAYATNPAITPQIADISKWSVIAVTCVGALIGPWLAGLLVSLFALFFGQFQEERVGYVTYLGMVGYARIPLVIANLVGGALGWLLAHRVQNFSLSLAVVLPKGSSLVLNQLVGMVNPFGIWYYILLAIGFGAVHRGKANKGLGLVLTIFIILAVLGAGSAALGSKLAVPGVQ